MTTEQIQIDINRSDVEALASVPKLGPYLAGKIIEKRPYNSLEDLTRVNGIGPRLLESIRPYLTILISQDENTEPEPESAVVGKPLDAVEGQASPEVEASSGQPANTAENSAGKSPEVIELPAPVYSDESDKLQPSRQVVGEPPQAEPQKEEKESARKVEKRAGEPVLSKELLTIPQPAKKSKQYLEKKDLWLYGLLFSLATLLLSVFLALAVLGILNGGITFASSDAYNQLQAEVKTLQTQTNTVQQDLNSLRSRLDALETISGRVNDLEYDLDAVGDVLEKQENRLKLIESDILKVNSDIEKVNQISEQFSKFISGMQSLITDIQLQGSE